MREYNHLAVLTAMVHDESSGRVTLDRDGRPSLDYELTAGDRDQLGRGLAACARLLFAAGAHEVMIPATAPVRLVRAGDLDRTDLRHVDPRAYPLTSAHPAGTLRMGDNPETSVVGSTGEHHQVRGLFVADASLFPTSIGVPPQISVYALALHLSRHIIAATKR